MSVYPVLKMEASYFFRIISVLTINFPALYVHVIYGTSVCMYTYIQYKYQCLVCSTVYCK